MRRIDAPFMAARLRNGETVAGRLAALDLSAGELLCLPLFDAESGPDAPVATRAIPLAALASLFYGAEGVARAPRRPRRPQRLGFRLRFHNGAGLTGSARGIREEEIGVAFFHIGARRRTVNLFVPRDAVCELRVWEEDEAETDAAGAPAPSKPPERSERNPVAAPAPAPASASAPAAASDETAERADLVVGIVDRLIHEAIERGVSDIHFRPTEQAIEVAFRADGVLLPARTLERRLLSALTSRIKILGKMDIAERRLPQDGACRLVHEGRAIDLRFSTMPTIHGESIVVRILDPRVGLKALHEIGFSAEDEARFHALLQRRGGMLLITGPTGSGKTTTLYAALSTLRDHSRNIISIEDPVEYQLAGIKQIEVNAVVGNTFARTLRHVLRHDPDVILIGEIRDRETGKIAVESAFTGHLVLATLHARSAAGGVTRLLEMAIEPYKIKDTLLAILAQRLVRTNCPHCLVEESASPALRERFGLRADEPLRKGGGCEQCHGTGCRGRIAVYELLTVAAPLRDLIQEGVSAEQIHRQALRDGMRPFAVNAGALVRQGRVSLAEMIHSLPL